MNKDLQNGISGAIIGATLMFGGMEVAIDDTDPITGEEYSEIVTNPEKDVYYNFPVENLTSKLWEKAHQKPETARYSNDGSHVILKFDVGEIPRTEQFPEPMTQAETIELINSLNGGYAVDLDNI